MAIGKKTGGKDFKRGNRFSLGRPKVPDELKGVSFLSREQLKRTIFKYLGMTPHELQNISKEGMEIKAVDLIIIKFIFEALKGDHYKAEWLIQRSVGKVTEEQEVKDESTAHSKLIEYIKERAENK